MSVYTVGLAEAKNNFSRTTAEVNRSGKPVTVLKNNKPWVIIAPAAKGDIQADVAIDILGSVEYAAVELEEEK